MPEPAQLLQSQKNEVFLAVKESGLDPASFVWDRWESDNDENAIVSALVHQPTRYWFKFDMGDEGHLCAFSPAEDTLRGGEYPGNWNKEMSYVRKWLTYLKREAQAPDLWTMLSGDNTLSEAASPELSDDNAPFSVQERRRVENSLAEIRSLLIASTNLSDEMLGHVDARLEYLNKASERLGRKDWLNVAFSVITNIIIVVALPPETARNILNVAGTVLNWVLGGSPLLPSDLH